MSDLRELYQEVILDHSKRPRNRRVPEAATLVAHGHNPLCGDRIAVHLAFEGDRVVDVGFDGAGCAISTASASLMTEAVRGKSRAEVESLFAGFHALVTGEPLPSGAELGKLEVLGGVREFPMRVKCASLAWHTLIKALAGSTEPVSTE